VIAGLLGIAVAGVVFDLLLLLCFVRMQQGWGKEYVLAIEKSRERFAGRIRGLQEAVMDQEVKLFELLQKRRISRGRSRQ
jgi:hypothetical protein